MKTNKLIKHDVLKNFKNVENVKISSTTMRLLKCKAMLSDVFDEVNNVCEKSDESICIDHDTLEDFNKALSDLDGYIMTIIADVIGYVSIGHEYTII